MADNKRKLIDAGLPPAKFGIARHAARDGMPPDVCVVAPMYNEEGGACSLVDEIAAALKDISFEIIIVDDNSSDATLDRLMTHQATISGLRVIHHHVNAGQSRAIRTGILAAAAPIIVTLDGDGQNDPCDIPALYDKLLAADCDMIAGERIKRKDTVAKRWASRIANSIRQSLLSDGAADTGCGLKVFRREAYLRVPFFDHQHRYLPALFAREGFEVGFSPVSHRPRLHGRSKYTNFGRLVVAFRDIMGVLWLNKRARSPIFITEVQNAENCGKPEGLGAENHAKIAGEGEE